MMWRELSQPNYTDADVTDSTNALPVWMNVLKPHLHLVAHQHGTYSCRVFFTVTDPVV